MRRLPSGLNDKVGAVNYLEKLYEVAMVDGDYSDEKRSHEFPPNLSRYSGNTMATSCICTSLHL